MVISQLVPVGEAAGLGAAAGLGLTIGAIGNTGGRVLSGWMSDTFGRLNTLRLMVLLSAVALPLFYLFAGQVALFYLLLIVIYYCYGTLLSVFASTCADFYGTRHMGVNYGLLFSAWGVAGIVGPVIAGRVFDATERLRAGLLRRRRAVGGRARGTDAGEAAAGAGAGLVIGFGRDHA